MSTAMYVVWILLTASDIVLSFVTGYMFGKASKEE